MNTAFKTYNRMSPPTETAVKLCLDLLGNFA